MAATSERIGAWDADPNPTYNLWTIGNASEVVPGISGPWFSTASREHEYGSAQKLVGMLGIADLVACYPPPVANWAGVYAGRWALNLAWFGAVLSTWQTEGASGALELYITSTDGHDISAPANADVERAHRTLRRVRRLCGGLPRAVERDRRYVEALLAQDRARDYSVLSDKQIWRHLQRRFKVCTDLLARHLTVSGIGAGDYTDRLGKLLDRALPGHDPGLVIALTSGLSDVESARPAKAMYDVASFVNARPALAAQVRELSPSAIAERLRRPEGEDWQVFARRFAAFIAEFGFRGQGEVDPSFADWQEEPAYALSAIKALLDVPAEKSPYALERQAAQQREAMEAQIAPAIPRGLRAAYRELLAGAQRFTRLRESSKANWVRADRTLRPPLLELGRRFVARGLIEQRDDLFWLLGSEVEDAIYDRLHPAQSLGAPEQRRREAQRLDGLDLPEVFQLPVQATPKSTPQAGATVLSGMPVSAGKASGPARVVLSTESAMEITLEPGEVLVAPFTDAPWTPLFVPAAAVVVETGGVLSHAATVAREFGIPAVAAVKNATTLIRTGQLVTVDGLTGTVTIGE